MAHPTEQLLGDAPAIAELRARVRHLASFDRPGSPHVPTVLVLGETGTGKGLVARLLHESGARAGGAYVDVNCAAIPETMLEAELFGFEAGAFTDARRPKPGLFEAAAGGTLFLDEIDALPLALQGKLLKAIEEKRVRRLGAVADRAVDVRLVAATQRDLREMMAERTFRADLFHRLAVVVLEMPPLRARAEDVVALAEHYLRQHAAAHGIEPRRLDDGARAWLRTQPWPGNVRELSHLVERVTLLCPDGTVTPAHLESFRLSVVPHATVPAPAIAVPAVLDDEAARITAALARAGGNVVRAAKLLGIGRNALRGRMQRLGIERPALDRLDDAPPPAPSRPSPPSAGEPTWEQKAVAVLALDLDLPAAAPEPWTIAHRWQRTLAERVAGFGGVLVHRTSTRATIVFGVPRAIDQLPLRAVQAAFALQRSLDDAGELQPTLRCALHTGFVRVDVGAADAGPTLLPVGDTIALAERLLGHAGPGETLASAAFGRRVQSDCTLRPRTLRVGESDTVEAVVVVGRVQGALGVDATFVGRARELEQLRAAFASTRDGHGELALVVGEPGIGKSRLLAEFRRELADVEHHWVEGRCASYAATTALYVLSDAVRVFCGIDDRDDAAVVGRKLATTVQAMADDLAWTVPFLRAALALEPGDAAVAAMDSASRRSETVRAFKTVLLRLAAQRPLVIAIEDLHWIDPASEECLAFLADAVPSSRTLMICTYRPGYKQPFGDHTFHVRIPLRALAAADVARMSGALLGGDAVPDELQALIAAKAEGNPFFVEEVTRHLLDGGVVRHENGRVTLACDPATLAVPDTIHEVLAARIDRLADDARRAIQIAAVIGREFALRLLARITEAGDRIRTQVDELRALELIYEKAADPELAFMFKHALTHDVAYASVMTDRRRALHRTIGLAIEELYADRLGEMVETLAHHFECAEEWPKAFAYHERAAAKAGEHFANRAVIAHCRRALAIIDRLPDDGLAERRRQLEMQLALASFYVSDFGDAGEAFERAAALAPAPAERGVDLGLASLGYAWGHRYDDAGRTARAAVEVGQLVVAPPATAFGLSMEGFLSVVCRGDVDDNEHRQIEALGLLRDVPTDEATRAMVRFHLALGLEWTGDYRRSIALSEEVIAAGRRLRLPHLVVWPAWFLGKAYCCLGEYRTAIERLGEATAVCDRIGDRAWKSRLLNTLGWCHAELGDVGGARLHNERAAALAHAIRDPEIIANSEINLAGNWLAQGDLDRAQSYLDPLQDSLRTDADPWMRWRWSLHLVDAGGRIALARGRADRTLAAADEQLAGARRHRVPKIEGRALALRAEALLALDRRAEAREAASDAIAAAERIGYPRTVWQSLGLLVEIDRRDGRTSAATETAARREALLTRLAAGLDDAGLRAALRAGR